MSRVVMVIMLGIKILIIMITVIMKICYSGNDNNAKGNIIMIMTIGKDLLTKYIKTSNYSHNCIYCNATNIKNHI